MFKKIKKIIRSLIGLRNDTDYYSQGGEDAIVFNTFTYLIPVKNGFYIDIGAYHPFKHSNTYLLYKAGWKGINIDPRPGSKALFNHYRRRDINIEAGIAANDGKMIYYMLDDISTMNTFSKDNLERNDLLNKVTKTVDVSVFTLNSLLQQYPHVKTVDYLNIDAEGFEMEVLSGLDFSLFAPRLISIEQNDILNFEDVLSSVVAKYLISKGYSPYAKNILLSNVSTVFYIHNQTSHLE